VKPQLPDDDVAQHLSVQERLRRLESATAAISVDPDGLGFRIGGIHERWGVEVLTWSGAANSNTITVAHGLGKTPTAVVCTGHNVPAFGELPIINAALWDDETFSLIAESKSSWTGDVPVSWRAVA
jgi:hypothetical protein